MKHFITRAVVLLFLSFFLFLLFFHRGIETEDVWLHLSIGQWIIHHSQVPHIDEFPFAHEKTPYLCHEWLASSLIFLIYKAGGFTALKIFRALFFMLAVGIFLGFCRRRLPFSLLVFLTLLISFALFERCLLRPDTFNLLFVQIFLIALFSYEKDPRPWKLIILPFISVLWINLHMMGAFIYGGSMILIFLFSALIKRNQIKAMALLLLAFLTTFIINPYGFEGLLFPYKVFLFPKFYGIYKMISITGELQYPIYIFFSFNYFYYLLLIFIPILLMSFQKKADLSMNLLFIFALMFFFYMSRNSSFFTLVAAYTIARGAQNIYIADKWAKLRWSALADRIILTGVLFFVMIQSINMINESVYFNGKKGKAVLLDTNPYVLSTLDLLRNNGIQGPVFNCTLLGGTIIWYDYPALRPFDDGRHLDYQRFSDDVDVLVDPAKNWHRVEDKYGFKIVILTEGYELEKEVIKYLASQKDWQLIAVHGPFVTFVKRGAFPLPEALDKYEQRLRSTPLTLNDVRRLRAMLQEKQRTAWERFFDPGPLKVDLFSDGVSLMNLGYKGPAAGDFIQALKVSDQPYMHNIVRSFLIQSYK